MPSACGQALYRVSGPLAWVQLLPGSSLCLAPWTGHPTFAILRVECVKVSQRRVPRNQLWLGGWRDMTVGEDTCLVIWLIWVPSWHPIGTSEHRQKDALSITRCDSSK